MNRLNNHLRRTFLAGIFAAVPVAVTAFLIWYIEDRTRHAVTPLIGREIPFIGVALALCLIYLAGLLVTSLVGQYLLGTLDSILSKLPGMKEFYRIWKQVALTPAGTLGMWAKVVLVRDESHSFQLIGFTSGQPIPGDGNTLCVFVPNYPNPIAGRLYFIPADACTPLNLSVDEAFKVIVSGGNYIPTSLGAGTRLLRAPSPSPSAP